MNENKFIIEDGTDVICIGGFGNDLGNKCLLKYSEKEIAKMIIENNNTNDNVRLVNSLLKTIRNQDNIIKEVREYMTSYESINTIQQNEIPENNIGLDEDTFVEMVRRYMIVHNKVLEILDKENSKTKEVMPVEIIEENKAIEKIDVNHLQTIKKWKRAKILGNKINEIIDCLNKEE